MIPRIMKPRQAVIFIILRTNSTCFTLSVSSSHFEIVWGQTRLAIALHAKELDDNQSDKQWNNPSSVADAL
jgi:hypothetical protein